MTVMRKWPYRYNEIAYDQISVSTPIGYLFAYVSGGDSST